MNKNKEKEMSQKTLLSVNHLTKTYEQGKKQQPAISDVCFNVYDNEFLAIMGTSGSGKSTLLHILGLIDSPDKGTITFQNKSESFMFEEPHATTFRAEKIGFVFQAFHLLKDLTVEENIALPLILKGESEQIIKEKVKRQLERVGLSSWATCFPGQLSGGQQQRVAIGRALIMEPPIVLADEPTGNLDYNTSLEILELLTELKTNKGQSIILVTHDPLVASYADRTLFFHDGQIVDEHIADSKAHDMDPIIEKFKKIARSGL